MRRSGNSIAISVEKANRFVFNRLALEEYNSNRSIFNETQRRRVKKILLDLKNRTDGGSFLDVGCGTGNLLLLAKGIYPFCVGVDIAEKMLTRFARQHSFRHLVASKADLLPFASETFSVVGMYAVLHHLYDPIPALGEVYRVLKKGGALYTDHDPNWYLARFYRIFYKAKYRETHGFCSREGDLSEYHHVFTAGLHPERLATCLRNIGFRDVVVKYRHSMNPDLTGILRWTSFGLRLVSRVWKCKSFYPHFMLFAVK